MASAPYDPNDPNAPSPAAPRRPGAFEPSYIADDQGAPRESRRIFLIAAVILALAAIGLIYWLAGERAGRNGTDGVEIPLVTAPDAAYKSRPADPGGEAVPHQDKEIYDRAAGNMKPRVEHLLPLPEEPVQRKPDQEPAPIAEAPANDPHDRDGMEALVETAEADEKAAPTADPKVAEPSPKPKAKSEPETNAPAKAAEPAKSAGAQPKEQETQPAKTADLSTPTGANDWLVQIAALGSQKIAENAWATFQKKYGDISPAVKPFYKHVEISGKGSFVRLRVGPFPDRESAATYCGALKTRKQDCLIIRPGR